MSIDKYVGRVVVIVYMDKQQKISKREIRVLRIETGSVFAIDIAKNQPRRFETERILAVQPVYRRVS
ncbi:hypothetical protein [Cohnella terricola]|uniref:WYL domain-containing protein n=1 Tax=Cohnella terricola TaxID=1289167 RepID=A0A559JCX6_9BACL|nr:hypothetical protein [Cohnella terricola]TVX97726.1 hypothetical protein FPZ45_18325 [Cohnella terricola]